MSGLPDAEAQSPACGCCHGETVAYDSDGFTCEDCQLWFDADDLSASFLDDRIDPCGAPCENFWHNDHKIQQGVGYDCGTCKLPTGHTSMHWTDCRTRQLKAAEATDD